MHKGAKPSMGGLAIFIGVAAGFIYLQPVHEHLNAIIIGACIMLITGIIDDLFEIRASYKLVGQLSAALVVVRSEEHTSELQSRGHLVCRLLLEQREESVILAQPCD